MRGTFGPASRSGSRRGALWALIGGDSVSITGNTLTMVAVPWFVLQTTGSAALTGVAGSALVLPNLISGVLGGPLVDRLGHRRVSIVSDLASGVTVAAIPLLHLANALNYPVLLVLIFLGTLLDVPGEIARRALLPDVAEQTTVPLERATSVREGAVRVAQMVGAPLAGFLIALLGAAQALFVDAATFAISALLVWRFVLRQTTVHESERRGAYLTALRGGLSLVWNDRLMRAILAMLMIANLLDFGLLAVLFPLYADQVLSGPTDLGLMIGAFAMGSLLGTIAYGALGPRLPRRLTFFIVFLISGAPRLFLLAAQPGLVIILPVFLVLGIAGGAINPLLMVVAYERIPATARGRVIGVIRAASWGAMPLGTLLAGFLSESIGLGTALLILGTLYLLATLSPAIGRVWSEMDRAPAT